MWNVLFVTIVQIVVVTLQFTTLFEKHYFSVVILLNITKFTSVEEFIRGWSTLEDAVQRFVATLPGRWTSTHTGTIQSVREVVPGVIWGVTDRDCKRKLLHYPIQMFCEKIIRHHLSLKLVKQLRYIPLSQTNSGYSLVLVK